MGSILHSQQSVFPCCENSKCTCTHMYTPGRVAHKVRSGQVLMEHCYLGAAESSSATDEQKAGLKSKLHCFPLFKGHIRHAYTGGTPCIKSDFMI